MCPSRIRDLVNICCERVTQVLSSCHSIWIPNSQFRGLGSLSWNSVFSNFFSSSLLAVLGHESKRVVTYLRVWEIRPISDTTVSVTGPGRILTYSSEHIWYICFVRQKKCTLNVWLIPFATNLAFYQLICLAESCLILYTHLQSTMFGQQFWAFLAWFERFRPAFVDSDGWG